MHYDGAEYARPELRWTQSSFIQSQMMVEDRYFYDPVAGRYTVDRYLDDLERRYGGIDAVLIWSVYPNIGIDNRNQLDMVRALPGGLAGVRQVVTDFHRRGVKVFFPVMPWDTGTRDQGEPLWAAIAKEMTAIGADGVNGDTMPGVPKEYREASDQSGTCACLRTGTVDEQHGRSAVEQSLLGLLVELPVRSFREQIQMARAAAHGQRLQSLDARPHR